MLEYNISCLSFVITAAMAFRCVNSWLNCAIFSRSCCIVSCNEIRHSRSTRRSSSVFDVISSCCATFRPSCLLHSSASALYFSQSRYLRTASNKTQQNNKQNSNVLYWGQIIRLGIFRRSIVANLSLQI